jgi:uncharacterized protein (TIGR02145 family)
MMKKYFLTTLFFLLTITSFLMAQTPERMSYQSVLRDAQNRLVTNRMVGVQISILQNSPTGDAVYVERQSPTTNAHGLVTVVIGTGQVISGSMATIQWENGTYYIRMQIDLNGGSNYTYTNTNQVLTVPYAFHAKTAETLTVFPDETDPKFTEWDYNYHSLRHRPTHVSAFINDVPYLVTETDPKFTAWGYEYDSLRNAPTKLSKFENDTGYITTEIQNLDSVLTIGNDAGGKQIKNLLDPTENQDAVTKLFLQNYTSLRVGDCDTLFLGDSQWVIIPGISVLNGKSSFPTVITQPISNIGTTSATFGGSVTSDGNSPVTARGVCWSTSPSPTIDDSLTTNGNGLGSFSSNVTGLTGGCTYYMRAYATNDIGTAYGHEESFTTDDLFTNCGSVTDVEGNVYKTVVIGSQCWLRENLRTTKYADGTSIDYGDASTSDSDPYYYYPGSSEDNVPTYGLLYNWPAVMGGENSSEDNPSGVQGVCPNGWHLPSVAEWNQLSDYVSSQSAYYCDNNHDFIAKAFAATSGWQENADPCAVGNNLSANNATGLTILPAGFLDDGGSYLEFSTMTILWSATEYNASSGSCSYLGWYDAMLNDYLNLGKNIDYMTKDHGFSVRCVRN